MLKDPDGRRDLLESPFAPGTSPFRIKGLGYRGHLEWVEKNLDGGVTTFTAAMTDPALRAYYEDTTFLPSTKYDILPLAIGSIVCGDLVGMDFLRFARMRTRLQAESDIGGVYRFLLKLVSAKACALYFPRVQSQYFDFGVCRTKMVGANQVSGVYEGIPELLAPWFAAVASTYAEVVLEQATVKKCLFRVGELVPEPDQHGIAMVTINFDTFLNVSGSSQQAI